jgi:hypothetical protein
MAHARLRAAYDPQTRKSMISMENIMSQTLKEVEHQLLSYLPDWPDF